MGWKKPIWWMLAKVSVRKFSIEIDMPTRCYVTSCASLRNSRWQRAYLLTVIHVRPPGGVFDKTSVKESPWQRSYRSRRSDSVECFEPGTPWNGAAATIRPNSPLTVSRDADTPNELGENRKNRYSLQATNSRCCMEISRSRSSSGSRCVVSPPKDKTGDRDDNQQDRRDGHPISYPSELMRPSPVLYRWRVRARLTRLGLERLG